MNARRISYSFFLFLLCAAPALAQTWRDDVGYTQLINEFGMVANGSGVIVSQVEAPDANGNYAPNVNGSEYIGKTITLGSGPSGTSGHANTVANYYYGNTLSIAGGVPDITVYEANDWIENVLNWTDVSGGLHGGTPDFQGFMVQNHSWIARPADIDAANATDILQRVDYTVNQSDVVMCVGLNNGASTVIPYLLVPAYNVISVGRTDGGHSTGTTAIYGSGRVKPEIVSPDTATSWATAHVSSVAAVLRQLATGSLANAAHSEAMKAILLAGATKEEFPTWDRTTTRPLDDHYGAGEVNIYNSYRILAGGEFNGSTSEPTTSVGDHGWDFGQAVASRPVFYDIDLRGTGGANQFIGATRLECRRRRHRSRPSLRADNTSGGFRSAAV